MLHLKYYYGETNTYYPINTANAAWRKMLNVSVAAVSVAGWGGNKWDSGQSADFSWISGQRPLRIHSHHLTECYAIAYI